MKVFRSITGVSALLCIVLACHAQSGVSVRNASIDLRLYFPVVKGKVSIFTGSKLNQKGDVVERYEIRRSVGEVREDKDGSIVSFSRIGTPKSYSNDGPEEYLVTRDKVIDYSGDGYPLLKKELVVGEQWQNPAGGKNATRVQVVSIGIDEVLASKKVNNCVVINVFEPDGQRYQVMTFAPGLGLIKNKIFIGNIHYKTGKADYVEVLK